MWTMELIAWMPMTKSRFSHLQAKWWKVKWRVVNTRSLGRRWTTKRPKSNWIRCHKTWLGSKIKKRLWTQKTKYLDLSSFPSKPKRKQTRWQWLPNETVPWTITPYLEIRIKAVIQRKTILAESTQSLQEMVPLPDHSMKSLSNWALRTQRATVSRMSISRLWKQLRVSLRLLWSLLQQSQQKAQQMQIMAILSLTTSKVQHQPLHRGYRLQTAWNPVINKSWMKLKPFYQIQTNEKKTY